MNEVITPVHFRGSVLLATLLHGVFLLWLSFQWNPDKLDIPFRPIYVKLGTAPQDTLGEEDVNEEPQQVMQQPVLKAPITQELEPIPVPPIEEIRQEPTPPQHTKEIPEPEQPTPTVVKKASTLQEAIPVPVKKVPPPPLVKHVKPEQPLEVEERFTTHTATKELPFVHHVGATHQEARLEIRGDKLGNRSEAEQAAVTNYEKQLALWLQKHHVYPLSARRRGLQGSGAIRLQIDRLGNVRFSEIAESTGHPALDRAIQQMVERASPVPPLPEDYPEEGFIQEFLIPIKFRLTE